MTNVLIEPMHGHINGGQSITKSFKWKKDAIAFAHEWCYENDVDNFNGIEGGGIGFDYRITVE